VEFPQSCPCFANTVVARCALYRLFFTYLCLAMTFYDKYPQLKQRDFLSNILVSTVFSTMSLEDQQVKKEKVQEIVTSVLMEQESKSAKLATD
jgi:hypothetical protein